MSSDLHFGNLSVSIFGESHGKGIGVVIQGLPGGCEIDFEKVLDFMARRAPKKDGISTRRNEKDYPEIMSGYLNGKTTGTPLAAVIMNTDQHSADYNNISAVARPGHADYTGYERYNGANDIRGGGHFSGRITAPLVFAGAVCAQILEQKGISCGAHILSIGNVWDNRFDSVNITKELLDEIKEKDFPVIDSETEFLMKQEVADASGRLDSIGGRIECAVMGNDEPFAGAVGEIEPSNEFYDFEAKYESDSGLHIPARLPEEKIREIQEQAVRAYKAWGCSGLARVDFFVRYSDGAVLLNEPNTLPGFTNISMYPMLMDKAGISYGDLIDKLCSLAIEKWEKEFAQ